MKDSEILALLESFDGLRDGRLDERRFVALMRAEARYTQVARSTVPATGPPIVPPWDETGIIPVSPRRGRQGTCASPGCGVSPVARWFHLPPSGR